MPSNPALLFREYMHLDRKRTGDGLTPVEYQRLRALAQQLGRHFSKGPPGGASERRESVRIPTRMKVSFASPNAVSEALMTNLSRGGLFVNTAFPAETGTRLDLKLRIESTGETLVVPVEVVSTNVGDGYATGELGMGLRFCVLSDDLRKRLDDFYESQGMRAPGIGDEEGSETS